MPEKRCAPETFAPQHGPRPLPLFLQMLREETAASPERREAALAGLRAFQQAKRGPQPRRGRIVARAGHARLRSYGGEGPPVVFVPSLINPPFILDLLRGNSLLRWLATQGVRPYLVDWGEPDIRSHDLDVCGHVEQLLVPLLRKVEQPPVVVGYCIGGTLAAAAAQRTEVAGLALIAAPWRFTGFGEQALDDIATLWDAAEPTCRALGLVPVEVLQSAFWKLDPARTIAKYERFGRLKPGSRAAREFIAVEDWANSGAPLTYAAGRQMFDDFFAADLPGQGKWHVGDTRIDPAALSCPVTQFVAAKDRIVPAASAAALPDSRILSAGHVGMVVGSRARAQLWEPLADWLSRVADARGCTAQTGVKP